MERFNQIQDTVRAAVFTWFEYGRKSSADPVNGATGFTDAGGVHFPNGSASEPYLDKMDDYKKLMTSYSQMSIMQNAYSKTGEVTSQLYPLGVYERKTVWNFTWFAY